MKIKPDSYMFEMIRTELTDAVGDANVDVKFADKFGHSIDYYWIPEMWHDRGKECPKADFIVHPGSTEEVAKVMKIANQYKIPVVPWGGGSGSQGGALPIYGGIILDMKRMNKFYGVDKESYTVRCQTGIIARHHRAPPRVELQQGGLLHDAPARLHRLRDDRRLPRAPRHGRPLHEVRQDRGHGDVARGGHAHR